METIIDIENYAAWGQSWTLGKLCRMESIMDLGKIVPHGINYGAWENCATRIQLWTIRKWWHLRSIMDLGNVMPREINYGPWENLHPMNSTVGLRERYATWGHVCKLRKPGHVRSGTNVQQLCNTSSIMDLEKNMPHGPNHGFWESYATCNHLWALRKWCHTKSSMDVQRVNQAT